MAAKGFKVVVQIPFSLYAAASQHYEKETRKVGSGYMYIYIHRFRERDPVPRQRLES